MKLLESTEKNINRNKNGNFNSEFSYIEARFVDQNSKPQINIDRDEINVTLVIN